MSDQYVEISCPNCESQYAVEFLPGNVNGDPDHCPFCGDEIPEEDYEKESGDADEEVEETSW